MCACVADLAGAVVLTAALVHRLTETLAEDKRLAVLTQLPVNVLALSPHLQQLVEVRYPHFIGRDLDRPLPLSKTTLPMSWLISR